MAQQYWVRGPAGQSGPFDQLQIRGLVAIGQLTATMEISVDGIHWQSVANVPGLLSSAAPATTSPPRPANSEQMTGAAAPLLAPSPKPTNSRSKAVAAAAFPCLLLAALALKSFHTYQTGGLAAVIDRWWPIIALIVVLSLIIALASHLMTKSAVSRWWAEVSSRGPIAWLIKHI